MRVLLATPRGFCAGVERAIEIVERALDRYGPPVYVRHEIVHNKHVVEALRSKGAIFVEELDEVPVGAKTIFSAHGVARLVERQAEAKSLHVIDATCPLVDKVHREGRRYAGQGYSIVLIGHRGHPEVIGTIGQIDGEVHLVEGIDDVEALAVKDPRRIAYITQTTLSVHDTRGIIGALRARFPAIVGPDTRDICYATQNRQNAVLALAAIIERLLVVGAANSSNSNRLREIGEAAGIPSLLLSEPEELELDWLADCSILGLTAGASAPEFLVEGVLDRLRRSFRVDLETMPGPVETSAFKLPPELLNAHDVVQAHAGTRRGHSPATVVDL